MLNDNYIATDEQYKTAVKFAVSSHLVLRLLFFLNNLSTMLEYENMLAVVFFPSEMVLLIGVLTVYLNASSLITKSRCVLMVVIIYTLGINLNYVVFPELKTTQTSFAITLNAARILFTSNLPFFSMLFLDHNLFFLFVYFLLCNVVFCYGYFIAQEEDVTLTHSEMFAAFMQEFPIGFLFIVQMMGSFIAIFVTWIILKAYD